MILHLARLEIRGFKSFEKKLSLSFGRGVTCVVGPNGCGKTNLLDALRWALGEQKVKLLRTDKMEGLIFNGSRTRKALHLAEVSVTFENVRPLPSTNFSSVELSRRLYRSGESEYALNGVSSRRKDIANLLLDTGTAFNAYSVIELKMVDDIIHDIDHARRVVFEEAAGIARTKMRKEETFKKLYATEADLRRVEDLLGEVSVNLEQAEREAQRARAYQRVKERYVQAHLEMAAFTLRKIKDRASSLAHKMGTAEAQYARCVSARGTQTARLQRLRHAQDEKRKTWQQQEHHLHAITERLKDTEHRYGLAQERLNGLKDRLSSLAEDKDKQKTRGGVVAGKIEHIEQEKKASEAAYVLAKEQAASSRTQYEEARARHRILKDKVEAQRAALASSADRHRTLKESLSLAEVEQEALRTQRAQLEDEWKLVEDKMQSLAREKKDIEAALRPVQQQVTALEQRQQSLESEAETHSARVEQLQQDILAQRQALHLCEQEGTIRGAFGDENIVAVAEFLKKSPPWGAQKPLLSEVLRCAAPYHLALGRFLGTLLHYFVLDTVEEALCAVSFLKEKKAGYGGFLVRALLEDKGKSNAQIIDNKDVIPAVQWVFCAEPYESLKHFLLRDLYFCASADSLSPSYLRSFPKSCSVLLHDGTLLRPATILGGGDGQEQPDRVGNGHLQAPLQDRIVACKEALADLQERLRVCQATRAQHLSERTTTRSALQKSP